MLQLNILSGLKKTKQPINQENNNNAANDYYYKHVRHQPFLFIFIVIHKALLKWQG